MRPFTISAAALLALCAQQAPAQKSYPEKPVRLVTGYLAGGGSDFVGPVCGIAVSPSVCSVTSIEAPTSSWPAGRWPASAPAACSTEA